MLHFWLKSALDLQQKKIKRGGREKEDLTRSRRVVGAGGNRLRLLRTRKSVGVFQRRKMGIQRGFLFWDGGLELDFGNAKDFQFYVGPSES